VSAPESLANLRAAIEHHIEQFCLTGNYFKLTETGGRLLARQAPLEFGASYWLITRAALEDPPEDSGLVIRQDGCRRGWNHYELTVPENLHDQTPGSLGALTRYLGRALRQPAPTAHFIDPPPHHIDVDGTHVFPAGTRALRLRRTPMALVSVHNDCTDYTNFPVLDDGPDWVRIPELPTGDFRIFVDGHECLRARTEHCELFLGNGIVVGTHESAMTPLLSAAQLSLPSHANLIVRCPTGRVADLVSSRTANSAREGTDLQVTAPAGALVVIDAGNLGVLRRQDDDAGTGRVEGFVSADNLASRLWLFGVLQRYATASYRLGASVDEIEWRMPRLAPHARATATNDDGL